MNFSHGLWFASPEQWHLKTYIEIYQKVFLAGVESCIYSQTLGVLGQGNGEFKASWGYILIACLKTSVHLKFILVKPYSLV